MTQHTAVATVHTNHGDIVINLFGDHAPVTVDNFIGLSTGEKEWTDPRTGEKVPCTRTSSSTASSPDS
jgi:peptidyl-prolyl cis-trans isomerase A (cyclophilin A)